MAITNYGELSARVISYAARGDLADIVEDFIRYPHDEIAKMMVLATDIDLDDTSVTLPSDCREVVALYAISGFGATPLRLSSEADMTNGGSGFPSLYRVDSGEAVLIPAPDQLYQGRLLYRPSRTFFPSDTSTNTVLDRYPMIYVHGAMAEFSRYDKDQAAEQTWEARFQAGLASAIANERNQGPGAMVLQTRSGNTV